LQLRNHSCELNAAQSDITLVAAAFSTYLIFCTFSGRDSGHPRDDAGTRESSLSRRSEYFSRCVIQYLKFSEKLSSWHRLSNLILVQTLGQTFLLILIADTCVAAKKSTRVYYL